MKINNLCHCERSVAISRKKIVIKRLLQPFGLRNDALICLSIFLIIGCASYSARKGRPMDARASEKAMAETAERKASEALVNEGLAAFESGQYDRASDLFQQAVGVDPSNGPAYYHLAVVKLRTDERDDVPGLIEKAETLLSGNRDWSEKIENLKREANLPAR